MEFYAPTLFNSTLTEQYWLSSHSPIVYLSAIDVRVQFNLFTDNLNYRVMGEGGALLYFTKFDTEREQEDKIYIDSSSTG